MIVVVQPLSHVQLCDPKDCSIPGFPVHHYLLGFAQTHVHWVGDVIHLILCHPLLLLKEETDRTGSILKAGLHLGPDCGLWAISPVSMEGEGEVAQSCPTLCDPMDGNLLGFSIHGILQARILEWIAISFSRGSSQPRDQTQVSRIGGRRFNLSPGRT